MRMYHLYLLQDDIAKTYFGREHLLFDLFSQFSNALLPEEKNIADKQIVFITKPLHLLELHHYLERALLTYPQYYRDGNRYLCKGGSMTLHRRYITVESEDLDIETVFFEVLRKYEETFLAMDYSCNRYGWLNPVKQERKYV